MKIEFQKGAEILETDLEQDGAKFLGKILGEDFRGKILKWELPFFSLKTSEKLIHGALYRGKDFVDVHLPEGNFRLRLARKTAGRGTSTHPPGSLSSPMPGKIIKVLVKQGDKVQAGDLLMVLEAMKMEHKIVSPQDGVVEKIFFKEGERVGQEVELVKVRDVG